jgi:HK97 family phage prohead protease
MNKGKETRYFSLKNLEVRVTPPAGAGEDDQINATVSGYVVKFNERSELIFGEFYEKVASGAFSRSLKENIIKALWNHDTSLVLGSTKSQTLRLREDNIGLYFEIDLPNNDIGENSLESIQRGDVDGVSFGFTVRADSWAFIEAEDVYERTLLDIDLVEISPTPFPAYENSSEVAVVQRSMQESNVQTKEQRHLQKAKKEQIDLKIKLIELEN